MDSPSETPAVRLSEIRTTLPKCPECGSYALYRDGKSGPYECLTCEKTRIPEDAARLAALLLQGTCDMEPNALRGDRALRSDGSTCPPNVRDERHI
jgi:tRNA(Ile2) C34 agmatinyltransferase TiaS